MTTVPKALVIFVFMCCVGLMFWALEEPRERRVVFVLSIAAVCALPYVPTDRGE